MKIDLTGQSALVTGASRGIGAAIARQLGASGARVCIHYGSEKETADALVAEIGNGAFAVGANLAERDACTSLWEEVQRRCGVVHALVNNAGVAIESPLDQSTEVPPRRLRQAGRDAVAA